jgi:hypothetical protein
MVFLTIDQFLALGKKCSHCDKKATWIVCKESPAYCDDHFPYWDIKKSRISIEQHKQK